MGLGDTLKAAAQIEKGNLSNVLGAGVSTDERGDGEGKVWSGAAESESTHKGASGPSLRLMPQAFWSDIISGGDAGVD